MTATDCNLGTRRAGEVVEMTTETRIIAGEGPVGLIAGLMLGRAGIDVTLCDMGDILYQHPRAATIHPATLDILDHLGVYARIEPLGIVCPIVNYHCCHPGSGQRNAIRSA